MTAVAERARLAIRTATRADLDALASLRPSVHEKHARALPHLLKATTHEAARREAETWLGQPNVSVLIAHADGEPVGYMRLEIFDRPENDLAHARRVLYLDQIAVRESGQGHGYGKALVAAAVARARLALVVT